MNTELSDEQLGRLWCERHGRAPDHYPRQHYPPWRWVYDDGPTYALPHMLWEEMRTSMYENQAQAYAAVGAALRALKQRAGEIADVLGGVL